MIDLSTTTADRHLARRYGRERRFRLLGILALALTTAFLAFLLADIVIKGTPAFFQHQARLTVQVDPAQVDAVNPAAGNYDAMIKDSVRTLFPEMTSRTDRKKLSALLSRSAADTLRDKVVANPALIGTTIEVPALMSSTADLYYKGQSTLGDTALMDAFRAKVPVERVWASTFWTNADSREPELAGLRGALIGSLMTVAIALAVGLPLGVAAAIYLEQFARKNAWTDLIEVNINNLAAVPSIIFGLLGLAIFLGVLGLPRSSPLVGGLVLSLLVLPTIIIAARAALKAVPPSIKQAALGVGASEQQAVFHHVLPLALPGILTGTILALARAFGETAPLLMIGMVAFIADIPHGTTEAATVLPVQIYLWSDLPELAFQSKTAAAIIVLLVVLTAINALAIYLRRRFERRW